MSTPAEDSTRYSISITTHVNPCRRQCTLQYLYHHTCQPLQKTVHATVSLSPHMSTPAEDSARYSISITTHVNPCRRQCTLQYLYHHTCQPLQKTVHATVSLSPHMSTPAEDSARYSISITTHVNPCRRQCTLQYLVIVSTHSRRPAEMCPGVGLQ